MSTPTEFDKELEQLLEDFQDLASTDNLSNDWDGQLVAVKAAIKQAVDKYVIGADEALSRAGNTPQVNSISGQNMLRKSQRQSLWGSK